MRSTLKDIARRAGCSVTTVSLVLNNKAHSIPDNTKKKVMDAVRELEYRPNQLAVGLIKKQTKTIGLVISDVSNNFFATLTKGVEDECHSQGWNLILCNTGDHHEREMEYIQTLDDKGADGIILCFAKEDDVKRVKETAGLLNQLGVPHVMVDRYVAEVEGYYVSVDHEKGGYLAGRYLTDMGHRKIGCITGPDNLEDSRARTAGFKQALEEAGVPYDPEYIYEGNYDITSGGQGTDYLMKKGVTAIFAYNELSAYGVYRQINQTGDRIPEDISVVGYDDVGFTDILHPAMTSIRQPVYEMGRESVRQMISIIKEKSAERKKVQFEPELVIRQSVADLRA